MYGGPGNLSMPSNTLGYCVRICSLLVDSLKTSCFFAAVLANTYCCVLWAATSSLDWCTDTLADFVFFGWTTELVIKLALGER